MAKIIAPWTEDQVNKLNAWQIMFGVHPFTCGKCSDKSLIATVNGWVCSDCDYTQNWAHDFMLLKGFSDLFGRLTGPGPGRS